MARCKKPKPPQWLDFWEQREWQRLWRQSLQLLPKLPVEDRARGVTSAFAKVDDFDDLL